MGMGEEKECTSTSSSGTTFLIELPCFNGILLFQTHVNPVMYCVRREFAYEPEVRESTVFRGEV